ncbi:MAG: AAA family ATPase [Venatoribacter sp.]
MSELLQSDDAPIQLLSEQEQDLELITHVSSFGDMLVAVTGPNNSGKTTLAYALMHNHDSLQDTLFIEASLELSFHSVLRRLADALHIQISDDDSEALETIKLEAANRAQQKRPFLLIIDQAEQIDAQTLNDIARLALQAQNGIYFALFGLTDFELTFNGGPTQAALHLQALTPLSDGSAQQLIAQVFNGDTALLSEEQMIAINRRAGGLPGQIISFAADSILAQETNLQKNTAASGVKLIPILALTTAVALLLLGFFYQSYLFPSQTQPMPEPKDVLHGLSLTENENTEDSPDLNFAENTSLAHSDANNSEPANAQPEIKADAPVAQNSQAQSEETAGEPAAVAEQPIAVSEKPAEKTIEKPADKPVAQPADNEKPATKPVATTKAETPVVKKSQPKTDSEKLLAIEQGFIIQLFGTYSQANANKYQAKWQNSISTTLYQYQTEHNGRAWYVVVTGVYKNRQEAKQAIQTWPKEIQQDSPWIRNIKVVQPILR